MKKMTHTNNFGDFKPCVERFYFGKELLLEIVDSVGGYSIGESINIGGTEYVLHKVVHYPEILITDNHLT